MLPGLTRTDAALAAGVDLPPFSVRFDIVVVPLNGASHFGLDRGLGYVSGKMLKPAEAGMLVFNPFLCLRCCLASENKLRVFGRVFLQENHQLIEFHLTGNLLNRGDIKHIGAPGISCARYLGSPEFAFVFLLSCDSFRKS